MQAAGLEKNKKPSLRDRLRVLEDKDAIRELKARYAYTLDTRDADGFLDLFIDDCIWESKAGRFQGKGALKANVERSYGIMPFFVHMYVAPVIEIVSETEAKGTWYMFEPENLVVEGEMKAVWVCARYDEHYIKIGDQWKYRQVNVELYFQTSFEKGWVKEQKALK